MDLLRYFEKMQIDTIDRPKLAPGDLVRVDMKVKEGDKERVQTFEGTILGIRGSGPSISFTVRREVGRFAVERIFPLYSPLITNIEIVQRQKVRRAKLSYLREAGQRRVKEDERAMQRHVDAEAEKKRLAEIQVKKAEELKAAEAKLVADAKKPSLEIKSQDSNHESAADKAEFKDPKNSVEEIEKKK